MVFIYLLCGKILMMVMLFLLTSLSFAQQSLNSFEPLPPDFTNQPAPSNQAEKQTVKGILKDSTEKLKEERKKSPSKNKNLDRPGRREKELSPPNELNDYEKTHGRLPAK